MTEVTQEIIGHKHKRSQSKITANKHEKKNFKTENKHKKLSKENSSYSKLLLPYLRLKLSMSLCWTIDCHINLLCLMSLTQKSHSESNISAFSLPSLTHTFYNTITWKWPLGLGLPLPLRLRKKKTTHEKNNPMIITRDKSFWPPEPCNSLFVALLQIPHSVRNHCIYQNEWLTFSRCLWSSEYWYMTLDPDKTFPHSLFCVQLRAIRFYSFLLWKQALWQVLHKKSTI